MSKFTQVMWKHRNYVPKGSGKFLITSDYEALILDEHDVRLIANAPEMYDLLKVWVNIQAQPTLKEAKDTARKLLERIDGTSEVETQNPNS